MSGTLPDPKSCRLAVLVDGDNAQADLIGNVLEEASKYGTVTIRRVYGNWHNQNLVPWKDYINKYAFQTPHQFSYTTGKNATDGFMIIDAMDILHSGKVDGFCIVSSDSDFTGLAKRIRDDGMFVMGAGRTTTPKSFKAACKIFIHTENLSHEERIVESSVPRAAMSGIQKIGGQGRTASGSGAPDWKDLFKKAVDMSALEDDWALLSLVGINLLKIDSSFDSRTYGHKKLRNLVMTAPDEFELDHDSVRIKQAEP